MFHKKGLKKATHRELSLLTISIVGWAYNVLLKEKVGFGYDLVGAVGNEKEFYSLFNESDIAQKMGKLLVSNPKLAFSRLKEARAISESKFAQIKKLLGDKTNLKKFSKAIGQYYPEYMVCLGVYNCFWRYAGDEESRAPLTKEDVMRISSERQRVAELYSQTEELIEKAIKSLSTKYGKNVKLVKSVTVSELRQFPLGSFPKELILRAKKRQKSYLYMISNSKEMVLTEDKIIEGVRKEFIDEKINLNEPLKGKSAFHGKAVGKVRIVNNTEEMLSFEEGEVLVSINTNPSLLPAMKKAFAIVCDEGGIMSHAAIIARELKKPCIIGVKVAAKVLKNGDLVEVDADNGIVKLLPANNIIPDKVDEKLIETAQVILFNQLNVRKNTKVLLINDHLPNTIFDAFKSALLEKGIFFKELMLSENRNNSEPIPDALDEMLKAKVIIAPTKKSITHCFETKKAVEKGARIITLPGINEEIFLKILEADFNEIEKIGKKIVKQLKGKNMVQIKTPSGTNISFSIKKRELVGLKPKTKGFAMNLPCGEIYCAPIEETADGEIFIDYFKDLINPAQKAWLKVENGKIVEWNDAAKPFIAFNSVENGFIIAEFGIGTNKAHKKPIGNVLHDEKIYKTVHIAFGNNTGFGGKNKSPVHNDIILINPMVLVDGKKLEW
ncbi:MAG: aminopeptidase [archaeon]